MSKTLSKLLASAALGLGLAAAPVTFDVGAGFLDDAAAHAKKGGNGGGKGNAGGNGGGKSNAGGKAAGEAGGKSTGSGGAESSSGSGHGKAYGRSDTPHPGKSSAKNDEDGATVEAKALGRLNGFLHAAPQAHLNAAPGSAVGIVSQQYAEALRAYIESGDAFPTDDEAEEIAEGENGTGEGEEDTLVPRDPLLLADAGAVLKLAANKPLTPEIVALINQELGMGDLTEAEIEALLEAAE